jgi:hypothetical protein
MKYGMVMPTIGALAAGPGAMEVQLTIAQRAEVLRYDSLWSQIMLCFPPRSILSTPEL